MYEAFTVISSKSDLHGHLTFLRTVVPFLGHVCSVADSDIKETPLEIREEMDNHGEVSQIGGGGGDCAS